MYVLRLFTARVRVSSHTHTHTHTHGGVTLRKSSGAIKGNVSPRARSSSRSQTEANPQKKRKTFKWCIETSEDFCAAHSCSEACWCEGRRTVALRLHCISRMAPSSSSSSSSCPPPCGLPLTQLGSNAATLLPLSSSSSSPPPSLSQLHSVTSIDVCLETT